MNLHPEIWLALKCSPLFAVTLFAFFHNFAYLHVLAFGGSL